jgi:glutamyl-tRNA synthetase
MLAVVVDDHDMDVTTIIRGDDHLTNAARQTQIYRALGWNVPQMAHVPLIHGADGAKLSKRHGALGVDAYRSMGYLPAALRNYLVRLGWSHGDQEIFSMQEMMEAFDLSSIGRSPARFDFAKLENLNGHYMRQTADAELVAAIEAILPEIGPERGLGRTFRPELRAKLLAAMPGLKERAKTLIELLDSAYYLYAERPLKLDDKAQGLIAEGRARLAGIEGKLGAIVDWKAASLEEVVRGHAETVGAKLGQVAQPLRAALTGRATSPGLFDVMAVLGKTESLARVQDQIGP